MKAKTTKDNLFLDFCAREELLPYVVNGETVFTLIQINMYNITITKQGC